MTDESEMVDHLMLLICESYTGKSDDDSDDSDDHSSKLSSYLRYCNSLRAIPLKSMEVWWGGSEKKLKICCRRGVKRIIIPCRGVQNNASQ